MMLHFPSQDDDSPMILLYVIMSSILHVAFPLYAFFLFLFGKWNKMHGLGSNSRSSGLELAFVGQFRIWMFILYLYYSLIGHFCASSLNYAIIDLVSTCRFLEYCDTKAHILHSTTTTLKFRFIFFLLKNQVSEIGQGIDGICFHFLECIKGLVDNI